MAGGDTPAMLKDALLMYARLSSYQDEGSVSIYAPKLNNQDRLSFETLYARPDLFRFKFASPHPFEPLGHMISTSVCGSDAAGPYVWSSHYGAPATMENSESLLMAIAATTGTSSGAAHNIAQLLLPEIAGASFSDLEQIVVVGDEAVDGRSCAGFRGNIPGARAQVTLFVDRETLVIPRIDMQFAEFSSRENRRNIRLNESIERSRFERPR